MTVAAVLGVPLAVYLGGAVGRRWTPAGIAAATLPALALAPAQRGLLPALNASMLHVGISLGSLLAGTFLPVAGAGPLPALGLPPLALAGLAHRASVRRCTAGAGACPPPAPGELQGLLERPSASAPRFAAEVRRAI
ncbi:hypothetical protein [Kitasatospora indigofera]|uniref:hypothetical protein n=1 Tax=Kitasatospora indigofera TaxID=67307 RepID=UPI0033BC8E2B